MATKRLPKIVVIVGPTASGKSRAAIRLAKKVRGEIVSADSRLLYRGMDIGTAKPTAKERGGISHHLIDVLPPTRTLTLAEYKREALRAIRGILKRGRLPIVVGGTGLYVQALVENLDIPEVPPDPAYRAFLERKGKEWILARLRKLDPDYAARIGPNPRYASRALEVIRATGKPFGAQQGKGKPLFDALVVGIDPGKRALERRIRLRVRAMAARGLLDEVRALVKRHGDASRAPALHAAIGYRELMPVLRGETTLADALKAVETSTRRYAKRQMTWWRRGPKVMWFRTPETALRTALFWLKSAK